MVDAKGDALEWAMALTKAPSERIALRQRPLPDGMERLLQVAAGASNDTLADFALQTGEDQADILEAARFYAREILFYQGDDAYRVLGVEHDADAETIRTHHRLLQQWLHPDRHTSDWDAIFAARVNAAWSQLRNASRRKSYDQENPPLKREHMPATLGSSSWLHPQIESGPAGIDRWRRRVPVLALFVVCGVLAVLAVRDMQREPEAVLAGLDVAASTKVDPANEQPDTSVVLRIPEVLTKPAPKLVAVAAPAKPLPKPIAVAMQAKPLPKPIAVAVQAKPLPKPIAVAAPAKPLPKPIAVAVQAKPLPKPIAVAVPAKSLPNPIAVAVPAKPLPKPVAVAAPAKPLPKPIAVANPTKPEPKPVPIAELPTQVESASGIAVTNTPAPSSAAVPASTLKDAFEVSSQHLQQVQSVGGQLIAYMSKSGSAIPPIWGSLTTQRGAAQLREDMFEGGKAKMDPPHWRVAENSASMRTNILFQDGRSGRLSANLAWREQRWLVTGLSVERDL